MTFHDFVQRLKLNNVFSLTQYINGVKATLNKDDYLARINRLGWQISNTTKGRIVVSILPNSSEWNIVDLAVLTSGLVHVPLSPTIPAEQLRVILKDLDPSLVVSQNHLIKYLKIGLYNCHDIKDLEATEVDLNNSRINIADTSCASYFFSSGTTGDFKAVMHNHGYLLENIKSTADFYKLKSLRALSILPIHYAFERMYNYVYQYSGVPITYANPSKSILDNILENKINIVALVPALIEKLMNEIKKRSTKHDMASWNLNIISSGAALDRQLYDFFKDNGVSIYEMFGSSETLIVAANWKNKNQPDSCGFIFDSRKLMLNNNNEILYKTGMIGYVENFSDREAEFKDGVYNTGDVGEIKDGFLIIKGRSKYMFKNAFGLFVNPITLENELKKYDKIVNVVIFGAGKSSLSCVIEADSSIKEDEIRDILINYNNSRKKDLRISKFAVGNDWSVEGGEYTQSMKVKRKAVLDKYRAKVKNL